MSGIDIVQNCLRDTAVVNFASKNLHLISLLGSPNIDIPLYFESVTFCGVDDGDVIGYKVSEDESIVLIVTSSRCY